MKAFMTSSEQARADAMADAETLELIADEIPERDAFGIQDALCRAGVFGYSAPRGALDFAYERGVLAARAAFRAVPRLRG